MDMLALVDMLVLVQIEVFVDWDSQLVLVHVALG
jgi:hypothetical protein